jgi:hypothetical protein
MRKWLLLSAIFLLLLMALTACGSDAHKGEHCVKSHVETYYQPPIYVKAGSVMIPVRRRPAERTVCDQYAPDSPATAKHS